MRRWLREWWERHQNSKVLAAVVVVGGIWLGIKLIATLLYLSTGR